MMYTADDIIEMRKIVIGWRDAATVTGVPKTGGSEVWMCEGCWEKRSEMFARRVPAEAQGASSHG